MNLFDFEYKDPTWQAIDELDLHIGRRYIALNIYFEGYWDLLLTWTGGKLCN